MQDMKYRAGHTYVDPLLEKQKAEADQKILSIVSFSCRGSIDVFYIEMQRLNCFLHVFLQQITKQDEIIQELQNAIIRTKTVLPKVFPCD